MKKLILSVVATVLTIAGLSNIATLSPAYAAPGDYVNQIGGGTGLPGADGSDAESGLMSMVKNIINVVIGVVGVIAVVMMIVGGISFITSQGDAAKVTKARNTILYGVVGLIVALLAFAIVNFVLNSLFNTAG